MRAVPILSKFGLIATLFSHMPAYIITLVNLVIQTFENKQSYKVVNYFKVGDGVARGSKFQNGRASVMVSAHTKEVPMECPL
jgi:hypothetical protein